MKTSALTYLSLAIAIAALCYAAWVHLHAARMAEHALQERERQLVRAFAPGVQSVYQGLGVTNDVADARTLEELFGPYVDVIRQMAGGPGKDGK